MKIGLDMPAHAEQLQRGLIRHSHTVEVMNQSFGGSE